MIQRIFLAVTLSISLVIAPSVSEELTSIAGVGARPLTDTLAATWFIESASTSGKHLAMVVFLLGPPGWTKRKTEWTWGAADPAFSTFVIEGRSFRVEYSKKLRRWRALGDEGPISKANVFVVTGLGTEIQNIVHMEHLDLSVPSDSDLFRNSSGDPRPSQGVGTRVIQPHNEGMNLTARTVTRLAWLSGHRGLERTRARRAPARSAGYARRYATGDRGTVLRSTSIVMALLFLVGHSVAGPANGARPNTSLRPTNLARALRNPYLLQVLLVSLPLSAC
jgi:hypothetical protein